MADVGGWTDTWFAESGAVCNVAVGPGARVEVRPRTDDAVRVLHAGPPGDTLLHDAAVAWRARGVDVRVSAGVPPGSALGTSASVLVALAAALAAAAGEDLVPEEAARRAHHVETEVLGRESGVQDHVAAACGGISWIEVGPFPAWQRSEVAAPAGLAERLLTVHLGGAHDSSALHRAVIERAEAGDGPVHRVLATLAVLAEDAMTALSLGDLDIWGSILTEATEAQAQLHPALVGDDARAVGSVARAHGAAGWKVNGAGGAGGTITVVAPSDPERRAALVAALPTGATVLDLAPAPGLTIVR